MGALVSIPGAVGPGLGYAAECNAGAGQMDGRGAVIRPSPDASGPQAAPFPD